MSEMTEFIASLPIETCKRRLESRHENFTFIAWKGQTRIAVKVKPVDANTYKFTLKRVSKSSPFEWGSTGGFSGYLRRLTSDSTAVVGQRKMNWLGVIIGQVVMMMAAGIVIFGSLSDGTFDKEAIPLLIAAGVGFNIIIFLVSYFYSYGHAKEMENTVVRVLGQGYDFGQPLNTPYA